MDDPKTRRKQPLGQILKSMELVSEGHIQEALQIQRKQGGLIGEILVGLGYAAREEILLALATQKGIDVADIDKLDPDGDLGPSMVPK
jgi:type IV pilus assembly protein PilB